MKDETIYTRPCKECKHNDPKNNKWMWHIECCTKGISIHDKYLEPVGCEEFEPVEPKGESICPTEQNSTTKTISYTTL